MNNPDPKTPNFKLTRLFATAIALLIAGKALATIPAAPVMTLYRFNGDLETPYYSVESVQRPGAPSIAGWLAQGTSVIPCLVVRGGTPLTDASGTPYVGFKVVVDALTATPASTENFKQAVEQQKQLRVQNHHCPPGTRSVIDVRKLYILNKPPFFDPSPGNPSAVASDSNNTVNTLDEIVRAFHQSGDCRNSNRKLTKRRTALSLAWEQFIRANANRWPKSQLERAKHLDYTMRTAIYESHLDRGCNAYGGCERNIIGLSIRNRGRETCSSYQGCRFPGDYQGVASKVSQYNIWDEYLTQITGLTSCFLDSYPGNPYYQKIKKMYEQNVAAMERILYGSDADLGSLFEASPLSHVKSLRHYYHAPAMGKCFPQYPRVEYMTGAVASKGPDNALIAGRRIEVGGKVPGGYLFKDFVLNEEMYHDEISIVDNYPGFAVDGRKVTLQAPSGCTPNGIPRGCGLNRVTRYRKTPPWLSAGRPFEVRCTIRDYGESCQARGTPTGVSVGGSCDTQMRPVRGVP